ncbi:MAG: Indole-3-glycerol phosphate synthase [Turneriella sp.]|nr:Indole-3-glycerol phosphate synthase [Turneriella sp.]
MLNKTSSILEKIVAESHKRAALVKIDTTTVQKNNIDFLKALRRKSKMPQLIAELKRRSPSEGDLKEELTVEDAISMYSPYAAALSILTEPNYFNGSLEDLQKARALTTLPILRKDFIVTTQQIDEARFYGANSFLLIAASLSNLELTQFIERGRHWNMEPLVEVLTEDELDRVLSLDIKILGINNRNLHTLGMDMERAVRLAKKIPEKRRSELVLVAESGYQSRDELLSLPPYFDAVLMGSSFMREKNPAEKLREIFY